MEVEDEDDEVKKDKKLIAETIEVLNNFFKTVSDTKTAVTAEERRVISSAFVKMSAIRCAVRRNPPPAAADIRECRSKMEKEISGICNKLSNLTIKDSYRRHLLRLKSSPSSTYQASIMHQGTRKQNSVKAQQLQQGTSITKENYLEKLILERKDYDETARFIETSLRMHTTKEDRDVLLRAYGKFIKVDIMLHDLIRSIKDSNETQGKDLNVPHLISNYRSIIVKELSECDKLSNLTIKEAYLHHIYEFKTQAKPKKYTQRFINQEETPDIFFKMKGGSSSGGSKSLNSINKQPHIHEDFDKDDYYDHNKCIEEERERRVPRFGQIGNWDPINGAIGADLLHAPVNHSVKVEHQTYYDMMREACKPHDTFPKYYVACYELFDDF
uniref:uncharacterized protein LOC122588851 isoform X2 n=1 Tax=Erigeron canadensis TaxID=72917 RepID=UPI001CB93DC3|nr:uncharacterized protein LOC122588851 isoform X2 [Erigeron canadensis]